MRSDPPAASASRPDAAGGTLVFHQAALGDFVLTWPLLRRLPRPVTVVAPWSHAHLAAARLPETRAVSIEQFEFTRMHAEGGPRSLSPAVRDLFQEASAVVGFVAGAGSVWAANADRLLAHTDRVMLDPRPPEAFRDHLTQWHASVVRVGIPLRPPEEPGRPRAPHVTEAADAPLLLHPGSGGVSKCWPRERFAALARDLSAAGHAVRFVLGEAEADRWGASALAELDVDGVPTDTLRSLDALAEAIEGCRLYLGNDAGPTHLAAQLGRPTLALFGPSDPARFHPVGPAARWLAPPEPRAMDWLPVGAVRDVVVEMLDGRAPA